VPDSAGKVADVVLGYSNIADWETKNGPYLGKRRNCGAPPN
jgi:hypothetical protein